jgi:hypothetical protein
MTHGGKVVDSGSSQNDFDFTLGEWDADVLRYAADGTVATEAKGRWSAKKSFGGKVVEDHFIQQADGEEDVAAFTLRTYCEETQRWEMVYLWATQPATGVVAFVGNRVDSEMHLDLQQLGPNGLVVIARIRFFDISDDGFSWENRMSVDNGATWFLSTLLRLRRRKDGS